MYWWTEALGLRFGKLGGSYVFGHVWLLIVIGLLQVKSVRWPSRKVSDVAVGPKQWWVAVVAAPQHDWQSQGCMHACAPRTVHNATRSGEESRYTHQVAHGYRKIPRPSCAVRAARGCQLLDRRRRLASRGQGGHEMCCEPDTVRPWTRPKRSVNPEGRIWRRNSGDGAMTT